MKLRSRLAALVVISFLSVAWSGVRAAHALTQPRWTLQRSPTTAELLDVSCSSRTQCMAVGANAAVAATQDSGRTWKSITTPYGAAHPAATFVSVRCPVRGVCVVLASPNIVLRTTDFGKTWRMGSIALSSQQTQVTRLACPSARVCYAIAPPSGDPITWFDHTGAILKSVDGGLSWQQQPIPATVPCPGDCGKPRIGYALQWISCQNEQSCYAGGDTFIGSHEGYAGGVLRTQNGGAAWTLVHSLFDVNTGTCPTASICTGVFYQPSTPNTDIYLARSTNGGVGWSLNTVRPPLTAIACTGKDFCELAGPHGMLAMAIDDRLFVQLSPTVRNLAAVACPARSACYAVGKHGTIVARIAR